MSKRKSTPAPARKTTAPRRETTSAASTDGLEQHVLAFAEKLGFMAGTIQTKAGALVDRDTLQTQLVGVRDGAKQLLKQLSAATSRKKAAPAPPPRRVQARSGGTVDAPGKKHRKPAPADTLSMVARSQAAKLRNATPMMKSVLPRARA
jgi:hypothetical protein